jgi:HSP20 family molecular chaperone IbpA
MKRLIVTLVLMLSLMLWALTVVGQKNSPPSPDPLDDIQRGMQLREEMHRQMMDKLLHGKDMDEEFFRDMDKFLEETLSDSLLQQHRLWQRGLGPGGGISSGGVKTAWSETRTGRSLTVTPAEPKQELDISVKDRMITIKGKSTQGSSVSSFTNSFSVPHDTDPDGARISQKDGKIVIELPFRATRPAEKRGADERTPLRPSTDAEIQI